MGHSTTQCLRVTRVCRGQNLQDALRADDWGWRCRGAMTPRGEPEKLAALVALAVLLAVLLQLAVLMMVLIMVLLQLAEPVLAMWAWWAALRQEPRSGVVGWEVTVARRPPE